jgi:serine/threonine-protein kinase
MTPEPTEKSGKYKLRLGKYEVREHIATGGMGMIYKAYDTEAGRDVALKILPPELAANPKTCERFRREAGAMSRLRHDNVVAVYEFGEAAGTFFLALEYVPGTNLEAYIEQHGPLKPDLARDLLKQAAKALAHAHSQGIVHRDIKPANFLLTEVNGQMQLKLTDLGLALRGDEDQEARMTREGTTVGTIDYIAPEQAHDSRMADIRSDIYSLGCTFFHMLAGMPPFFGGSLVERLNKHVRMPAPNIRQVNPAVPEDLAHVLERMLKKKPENRYQTPLDLLRDLLNPEQIASPSTKGQRAAAAGGTVEDSWERAIATEEKPKPARKRRRRRTGTQATGTKMPWLLVLAVAVGILILGAIIVFLFVV